MTDVVQVGSGYEQRRQRWSDTKHSYDVSMGVRHIQDMELLLEFLHGARGRTHSFRFKDYADFKSGSVANNPTDLDQSIGVGDGIETVFQITKTYKIFGETYVRDVSKPVAGTVVIAVDGASLPTGWAVDTTTGLVTFDVAPAASANITVGYEFDVPCRFEQDNISLSMQQPDVAQSDVTISEIRP